MKLSATYAERHVIAVVTLAANVVCYGRVDCPSCGKMVAALPDPSFVEVRTFREYRKALGRGPVVFCRTCKHLCEVIEHGNP